MLLEVLWLLPAGGGTGGEAACGTRASAAAPSLVALGLQGPAHLPTVAPGWGGEGGGWPPTTTTAVALHVLHHHPSTPRGMLARTAGRPFLCVDEDKAVAVNLVPPCTGAIVASHPACGQPGCP